MDDHDPSSGNHKERVTATGGRSQSQRPTSPLLRLSDMQRSVKGARQDDSYESAIDKLYRRKLKNSKSEGTLQTTAQQKQRIKKLKAEYEEYHMGKWFKTRKQHQRPTNLNKVQIHVYTLLFPPDSRHP